MRQILTLILILLTTAFSYAKTADSKNFPLNADNIYMMSLSALSKLNFEIEEMQSSSGYILFKTPNNNEYLLIVSGIDLNNSNVKITKASAASMLSEIQELIFSELQNRVGDLPKRVE